MFTEGSFHFGMLDLNEFHHLERQFSQDFHAAIGHLADCHPGRFLCLKEFQPPTETNGLG